MDDGWGLVVDKQKKKPKKAKATSANAAPKETASIITIDAKKVGILIGPKGATLKSLSLATGCTLDVNAPKGAQNATVSLSGPPQGIESARVTILELQRKGYASLLQSEDFGEFGVDVFPRQLSEIVGPGGRVIKALQAECNVKISIPEHTTPGKPCRVGIAGGRDDAKNAKRAVKTLLEFHHHEITHPGLVHELVHVPHEFFHCVIGPKGSEMRHIKGNYHVEVYVPNAESLLQDVVVVGKKNDVKKAISHIHTLMDRDVEGRQTKYDDSFY